MKKLQDYLLWLNGKKSAIGGYILLLALVIPHVNQELFTNIWHLATPYWITPVVQTLEWVGGVLTGAGALHKIAKKKQ